MLAAAIAFAGCAETETAQPTDAVASSGESSHAEEASWRYEGTSGPAAWGTISEEFATCSAGQEQSPIDIDTATAEQGELPALAFEYGASTLKVEDTGHGFKGTPGEEHTLHVGDDTYKLLQFHAHTPSEHTVDGEHYPMEVHFVHQNDAGELAVVGVMIDSGNENAAYDPFTASVGASSGEATIDALDAKLPTNRSYFTYPGSLTTPPCSEGVRWIVLREPVSMSEAQIAPFAAAYEMTNRPVQELHGRMVRVSG